MRVLQVTAHYPPSIGGVETHLADLVKALNSRSWSVFVLTYRPLHKNVSWKLWENENKLKILRIPWIQGFFYKLVDYPILEFAYLSVGLFLVMPWIILLFNPKVIHAHGLVAGTISVIWGKFFQKKVIISTHSIYNFPEHSLYTGFIRFIFKRSDKIITLSKQSSQEVLSLGIDKSKVSVFTYWVDLARFKNQSGAKDKLKIKAKFIVLFVGRLVTEKGVGELLQAVNGFPNGTLTLIAGIGPLEGEVRETESRKLRYLGPIPQSDLPLYYSAADVLIVPSIHEEGFGRVILESLACGTPIIGSNRGAIPEAIDQTVGLLINITPYNIKKAVLFLSTHHSILNKMKLKSRKFAEKKYSEKNVESIIRFYD